VLVDDFGDVGGVVVAIEPLKERDHSRRRVAFRGVSVTTFADCGFDVVAVRGVELVWVERASRRDDDARRALDVDATMVFARRVRSGEEDLRDCPFAARFGWRFLCSAS
jgi:hypothetical protein